MKGSIKHSDWTIEKMRKSGSPAHISSLGDGQVLNLNIREMNKPFSVESKNTEIVKDKNNNKNDDNNNDNSNNENKNNQDYDNDENNDSNNTINKDKLNKINNENNEEDDDDDDETKKYYYRGNSYSCCERVSKGCMRGIVTHHPGWYLRVETYNYTIKQYWNCCNQKKRTGPGCTNGPHPNPFGLNGNTYEKFLCSVISTDNYVHTNKNFNNLNSKNSNKNEKNDKNNKNNLHIKKCHSENDLVTYNNAYNKINESNNNLNILETNKFSHENILRNLNNFNSDFMLDCIDKKIENNDENENENNNNDESSNKNNDKNNNFDDNDNDKNKENRNGNDRNNENKNENKNYDKNDDKNIKNESSSSLRGVSTAFYVPSTSFSTSISSTLLTTVPRRRSEIISSTSHSLYSSSSSSSSFSSSNNFHTKNSPVNTNGNTNGNTNNKNNNFSISPPYDTDSPEGKKFKKKVFFDFDEERKKEDLM